MADIKTNHEDIEYFKRVSHGVGGSYQNWQGEPPRHAVYQIKTSRGVSAVVAYDLTERVAYKEDVKIVNGAEGPENRPFKNDADYSTLPKELQNYIREKVIEDFKSN